LHGVQEVMGSNPVAPTKPLQNSEVVFSILASTNITKLVYNHAGISQVKVVQHFRTLLIDAK
jgi:hypothetical protein